MVIGLIVAGAWIALTILVVSLCQAAGHADDVLTTAFMLEDATRPRALRRAPARTREAGSRVLPLPR
jgi:hypothetical protein